MLSSFSKSKYCEGSWFCDIKTPHFHRQCDRWAKGCGCKFLTGTNKNIPANHTSVNKNEEEIETQTDRALSFPDDNK